MTDSDRRVRRAPARLAPVLLLAAGAALAAATLAGCDNPACIFGGNCNQDPGGDTGLGQFPATFPENDQWVASGTPALQDVAPSGTGASSLTPFALRFSESMAPATLAGAFELYLVGGQLGDQLVPLHPPAATGDGRLVVLRPVAPLALDSDYELRASATAQVTDLDGTRIPFTAGQVLGTVRTEVGATSKLRLVALYPPAGSADQSRTTEIVAVFDRPVDPLSINPSSFAVTVDGVPPTVNPLPEVLVVENQGGATAAEGRILTWKSFDSSAGQSFDLGSGGTVAVDLSNGLPLSPLGGGPGDDLDYAPRSFTLQAFMAPVTIALTSASGFALGIDDLTGAAPFTVDLTFVDALAGDVVELYLFGLDPDGVQDIALLRQKTLTGAVAADTWTASEVALSPTSPPPAPVLSDGFVSFAYRVVRGGVGSPVRVLDVDAAEPGIQDPLLDTAPPVFQGFGADGSDPAVLRSTVRDLCVVGVADEEIAFADVDAGALGSNGASPAMVAGGADDGLFVARRIRLTAGPEPGLLDAATSQAGAPFTLTLWDRARNASAPVAGTFFHVGASGPGVALPGPQIAVEVRSAATLGALSGARVFVHDRGTGLELDSATTGGAGTVLVDSAPGGSVVTVELSGFDVFTLQDVPTDRLSVLLRPAGAGPGIASGVLSSQSSALDTLTRFHGDTRRANADEPLLPLLTCAPNALTGTTDCPFGPTTLRAYAPGVTSFVGVTLHQGDLTTFNAQAFLSAFLMDLPRPALAPGQIDNDTFTIAVPSGAATSSVPAVTWADAAFPGTDGAPRAVVEAIVHGFENVAVVGAAQTFPGDPVPVRAAAAGEAAGTLVAQDVVDAQFLLRLESRDAIGNRAAERPSFDPNGGALRGDFIPPPLPTITSPLVGATVTGPAFTVDFDAPMASGLYRLTLTGSNGRVWRVWVHDPGAAASVTALVPDLAGASPLGTGTVFASTTAWSVPALDPGLLLFTDPERRYDRLSERIDHSFTLQ